MQLITILLIAVAALTILTGLAILFGTTKQSRGSGIWFFIATLGAATWAVAISAFLSVPESAANILPLIVVGIIAGITLTDVALLGYTSWTTGTGGKLLTVIFGVLGAVIIGVVVIRPELFYSGFTFGKVYNGIELVHTWYFYALIGFFTAISLVYSNFLTKEIKRIKNKGAKTGLRVFQAGLSVGGILALVFDLILLSSHPQFAWIGPMAVSVSIIAFYYSVVKYRIIAISGKWMEVLSYIILIAAGVVVYTLIFYTVFMALFRVPNPSSEILILNFIMVLIVLCLMPALAEISAMIKALLPVKQINVGYIAKKLNLLNKDNVDLKELASFLSTQLKLDYFGFLIHGHVYGSKSVDISADDLVEIEKLKLPDHGVWQKLGARRASDDLIYKVAVMYDNKGKVIGQALIGRSTTGRTLERRDLVEMEMAIGLSAAILDGDKSL